MIKNMPAFDGNPDCPLCHGSGTLYDLSLIHI